MEITFLTTDFGGIFMDLILGMIADLVDALTYDLGGWLVGWVYDMIFTFCPPIIACFIDIPISCFTGLIEISESFYSGIWQYPAVLLNLICHLLGKA